MYVSVSLVSVYCYFSSSVFCTVLTVRCRLTFKCVFMLCRCESGALMFLGQIGDSSSSFHDLLSSSDHMTYIKVFRDYY